MSWRTAKHPDPRVAFVAAVQQLVPAGSALLDTPLRNVKKTLDDTFVPAVSSVVSSLMKLKKLTVSLSRPWRRRHNKPRHSSNSAELETNSPSPLAKRGFGSNKKKSVAGEVASKETVSALSALATPFTPNLLPPEAYVNPSLQVTQSAKPSISPSPQSDANMPPPQSASVSPSPQSDANTPPPQSASVLPSPQSDANTPPPQSDANTPHPQSASVSPSPQSDANTPPPQSASVSPSLQSDANTPPPQSASVSFSPQSLKSDSVNQILGLIYSTIMDVGSSKPLSLLLLRFPKPQCISFIFFLKKTSAKTRLGSQLRLFVSCLTFIYKRICLAMTAQILLGKGT
uniref:Uncharacterized protein n=1 Tax=Chromera velia CCMP2878 TaxID=1169474 RepID=A0A0G4HTW7_9ALVE|eukprot:Cvel_8500.t1-p1 / transcript=Cvel_8500.t1 / gene=Cvel_8500 / organism=Chromera_velia_CCMP2878 / gene_product=Uncharacterized protein LOC284861, putative / transcript_product=Uncharacterized protein LOC284861, putative / location=Cvel_scaffold470:338-1366(+) / protein_length=343 / sequence_SO=supercontig / SO=protein_coding / is_pseudo=false